MQPKFTQPRLGIFLKLIPMLFLFCFSVSKTNAQCAWSASTAYPINILDNGVATVGSNMYSFAGVSGGAVIATAYRFDGTTWTSIAPVPAPKEFPGTASDGTNIFIMGGYDGVGLVSSMYRYNVALNTYTLMAPMPVTAWALTAVYFNGKIYRFGGQIDLVGTTTNALHIYDIATNTWSTGAPIPQAASFIGGFELGGKIYAVGGNTGVASNKTYQYDPVANTWSDAAIADLPGVRWGAATANYGGFGVMAGGYDAANPTNTAILWDPVGNAWSTIPNMLADRARMNGAVLSSSFYVIGGRCTTGGCTGFTGSNNNQKLDCNFTPCSGTPNPGATTSSGGSLVCPTIPFTLGITNAQGPGSLHQWQSSPTGAAGSWTSIPTATGSSYTTSITTTTWFRDSIRCTNSSQSGISTPIQININTPANCYCIPTYSNGCTLGDYIARVRLNTLDNSSLCSTPPFTYYSAVPATTILTGITQQLIVNVGPDTFGQNVGAWIDYNIDGVFQTTEFLATPINAGANGQATLTFTVPATATLGTTRLRIRGGDDVAMTSAQACGPSNSTFGEAEDYNVTIAPCVQGVFTAQPPATTSVQCSGNVTISATATGSLLQYQWEYRTTPTGIWQNLNNGGTAPAVSNATTSAVTLSNVPSTWNGYQLRLVMQGPCTAVEVSTPTTLNVTALVAGTNISSANICNGQIQQLTLTNAASTSTQNFTSGPINIPIPDANVTGINHTIPVSLPGGSVITQMVVRFSIPAHTWPGDLIAVVKAPNGQILNLDYLITGTGAGPGNGMVDTKFTSVTPSNALSSGTAPYSGTYRPDAQMTPIAAFGNPPTGPTGYTATTPNYSALWTVPSGNYTLAIYDAFGGDVGSLTNWQIDITYGAPAAGIWTATPSTPNTMFTDPSASTAYVAGTPMNTIYVKPSVNTVYCVTYSTSTPCVSGPTCIPVNVFNPITNLAVTPTNPAVCVGNNITLAATAGGGPASWQWQVSVDGGVTWTNISGATNSTLTLSNVTASMNNNRYRVVASATPCSSTQTSTVQVLKVNLLPKVTISSPKLQLVPGDFTTITASSDTLVSPNRYTWTLNGGQILGATTNSVVATIDKLGNYQATVIDTNGCVGVSNVLVIGGKDDPRVWIYPNPTNDGRFQVRVFYDGNKMVRRKIVIYTADGRKVAEKWFDLTYTSSPYMQMDFDLRNLPSGTYLVKVNEQYLLARDENVKQTKSGWLIIQR